MLEDDHEIKPLTSPQYMSNNAPAGREQINEKSNLIDIQQTYEKTQEIKSLIEIKLDNELVLAGLLSRSAMSDLTTTMLIHARSKSSGSQITITKSGAILVLSERSREELSEMAKDLIKSFNVKLQIGENEFIFPTISAVLAFTDREGATAKELYYAADQLIDIFSNSDTHGKKKRKISEDSKDSQEENLRGSRFEMCELI